MDQSLQSVERNSENVQNRVSIIDYDARTSSIDTPDPHSDSDTFAMKTTCKDDAVGIDIQDDNDDDDDIDKNYHNNAHGDDGELMSGQVIEKKDEGEKSGESNKNHTDPYHIPIDGGYGWIIVLGAFVSTAIVGGMFKCEGLLFLEFQEHFQTSAVWAALPGSLLSTVHLFMGPIAAAVCNRYSMRTAYMMGALMMVAGRICTGFASNIYTLLVTHTLMQGLGTGLLVPIFIVHQYFEKHRSLAIGITTSGVGVGTFVLVPLTQYCLNTYGFQGSFLLMGGVCLNAFVVALLFRPLSWHHYYSRNSRIEGESAPEEKLSMMKSDDEGFHEASPDSKHQRSQDTTQSLPWGHQSTVQMSCTPPEDLNYETGFDVLTSPRRTSSLSEEEVHNSNFNSCSRRDAPYMGSTKIISEEQEADQKRHHSQQKQRSKLSLTSSSGGKYPECLHAQGRKQRKYNWLKTCVEILLPVELRSGSSNTRKSKTKMFHFQLLKNIPFLLHCLSLTFFTLAFKTTLTFIPAIAEDHGLDGTERAMTLTILGVTDTFGRLFGGFLLNFPRVQHLRYLVYISLALIMSGVACIVPFLTTFVAFSLISAVYGLVSGPFVSLHSVVLADVMGRDLVPSAIGTLKVFQGIGTLVGPPIAGALRDAMGTYDGAFYMSSACLFCCGLLLIISSILRRRKICI